jgi:hypothetical protein
MERANKPRSTIHAVYGCQVESCESSCCVWDVCIAQVQYKRLKLTTKYNDERQIIVHNHYPSSDIKKYQGFIIVLFNVNFNVYLTVDDNIKHKRL